MLGHKRSVERKTTARTEIEHELAFDRCAGNWRHLTFDNRVALLIELNGDNFAASGISKLVLVIKPHHLCLVIDFDNKLFDKVAADDSVKLVSKPRGQVIERQRRAYWLRESFQS